MEKKMKSLTIIIPVYNEANRISASFDALERASKDNFTSIQKIIFVDDGSTDDTLSKIHPWSVQLNQDLRAKIETISYPQNTGRGYAVREGLKRTDTDYALYVDADMSIPLSNLRTFTPYLEEGYDLLLGSKKMPGSVCQKERSTLRKILGFGHSLLASLSIGKFYWDVQGGFKILSRRFAQKVLNQSEINRWSFDMEIVFLATRLGFKTVEIPVVWKDENQGSKVNPIKEILPSLQDMWTVRNNWALGNKPSSFAANQVPAQKISI